MLEPCYVLVTIEFIAISNYDATWLLLLACKWLEIRIHAIISRIFNKYEVLNKFYSWGLCCFLFLSHSKHSCLPTGIAGTMEAASL